MYLTILKCKRDLKHQRVACQIKEHTGFTLTVTYFCIDIVAFNTL